MIHFDVRGYVQRNLSGVKETGGEALTDCPFCGKAGHLSVNLSSGHFICFRCEAKGRHLVGVIAAVEGISREEAKAFVFREAASFARRRSEPLPELQEMVQELRKGVERQPDRGLVSEDLPEAFTPVWDGSRFRTPSYLLERGFSREAMKEFEMGFCSRGRYAGRVILPFSCPHGRSFTARDATGHQRPRYLNPKGVDHGRLLYGWFQAHKQPEIVLVEGPFDVVRLWEFGIPAIGLLGKMLTRAKRTLLSRLPPSTRLVIMLDPEENEAPERVALGLASHFDSLRIAKLPLGVDPGSSEPAHVEESVNKSKLFTGNRLDALEKCLSQVFDFPRSSR